MNKFFFFSFFILCFNSYSQEKPLWTIINDPSNPYYQKNSTKNDLKKNKLYTLKEMEFKEPLLALKNENIKITFPNSNGELEQFTVTESSNFAPQLQEQYPEIRSYSGIGITDSNATISFSISPNGIQSMILRGDNSSEYIDPIQENKSVYILSTSKSKNKDQFSLKCKTANNKHNENLTKKSSGIKTNTGTFKTIRLALSCTGEYANYFGGTVSGALAGMNATLTRVNAVFNRDLAIKLQLIPNNNLLIYTNATQDPYSNEEEGLSIIANCMGDCPGTWNKEVQNTITNVIGENNYDIGHLFAASGGGGDAGCIGCICNPLTNTDSTPMYTIGKGSAYTSPADSKPEGSSFDIDYVAHEIGHQLGANHTFSFDVENTGMNVEPGSGSTIMGYAGITDYDIQNHSDNYFAYASILQIQNNLALKTCPTNTILNNQTPTINAGDDYIIPKSTPFKLTGSGSDPNGNTMTYCWEQYDSATIDEIDDKSIAYETKLNGALFRSFPPSSSPIRYFPELTKVLSSQLSTTWESVCSVGRILNFTLTGRDNAAFGLGQTNTDAVKVTINTNAGPFIITSQNNSNINWNSGDVQTINWTVNNTNNLPGSANVNIKLSSDGGLTFPITLASNLPNNGTAQITVPDVISKNCRLLIEPTANIYFAVNSTNFSITKPFTSSCNKYIFTTPFSIPESEVYNLLTINAPASTEKIIGVTIEVKINHSYLPDVELELINPQGTSIKLFEGFCGAANNKLYLNFDDSGTALSCSETAFQTIAPAQPLSTFNNLNPEGTWTLKVRDAFPGDTGILESASLTICTKSSQLSTSNFEINNFTLYPNPNKGNFTIFFRNNSSTEETKVIVYNMLGTEIFSKTYQNDLNSDKNIELKNIPTGVYLLKIINGNEETIKKVIIE